MTFTIRAHQRFCRLRRVVLGSYFTCRSYKYYFTFFTCLTNKKIPTTFLFLCNNKFQKKIPTLRIIGSVDNRNLRVVWDWAGQPPMNITYKIHTGWFEFYSFYLNEVKWLCNVWFFFFNCVKVATCRRVFFCHVFIKVKEISKELISLQRLFFRDF